LNKAKKQVGKPVSVNQHRENLPALFKEIRGNVQGFPMNKKVPKVIGCRKP